MKKLFLLGSLLFISTPSIVYAQNRSIHFEEGSWRDIQKKAAKENKLIFLDAFASWCGPCKWMAKNVFTNDTVADYFNSHFVCAKIDMEIGEGKDIAKQLQVHAYPNLLFTDATGNMVHRSVGSRPVQEFIALAEDAQNSEKAYSTLLKKYEQGIRTPEFMLAFLRATEDAGLDTKAPTNAYFATIKDREILKPFNWSILYNYLDDMNNLKFKYLLNNLEKFETIYTKDSVSACIYRVYEDTCNRIIRNPKANKQSYFALKENIQKSKFRESGKLLAYTDLAYYRSQNDWEQYATSAENIILHYLPENKEQQLEQINSICWTIFEKVSSEKILTKSLVWGDALLKSSEAPYMDTYANILFKLGKKQDAIQTEEKVIALLKTKPASGFTVEDAEKTLEGFKK